MGTNNRERRRAKQKARAQEQRRRQERQERDARAAGGPEGVGPDGFGPAGGPGGFGGDPAYLVEPLAQATVQALHAKDERAVQECCAALAEGAPGARRAADSVLLGYAQRELSRLWQRGWQPADVVRVVRRGYGARQSRVAADVIAAELRGYAPATVHEHFQSQVRQLDATVWWDGDHGYLAALAEREGIERPEAVRCLLEVVHTFLTSPPIQVLCPPPGTARRGSLDPSARTSTGVDPRQLDRVRALLAKAEATEFEEEAAAYTAKAQELMARYSIDYALLAAGTGTADSPLGRRIGIDSPYEAPKVLLLDAVAGANHCRTVWSTALGFVTVLGFAGDIEAVELLFTSLLVQATVAMTRAGTHRGRDGRSTTRSFRQSFLTAYAARIRERLSAATERATEEAGRELSGKPGADRLLPVLASRDSAVGAMADELFPEMVGKSVSVTNPDGWASGRAAADRAQLSASRAVGARA